MAPDDVWEFVEEFTMEWNRLAAERNAARARDQTRLSTIQRKIDKLLEALMEGFPPENSRETRTKNGVKFPRSINHTKGGQVLRGQTRHELEQFIVRHGLGEIIALGKIAA